ncbi:Multidrug resistance efflux pump [Cribrihabitans marinus]|uniref:Multidrug resistance efflux pump n=1 Tax=Cribrihabitans marinus TaxID=1227549 RepID=A0A1H6RMP9_9RHOB|nr:biotin/lipoyl-binding protein [Cribrihabitans marinus]GGH20850.1 hemolysin D [Cribrihabitans marinus]SEI53080.1 Multidrug resistance efflux pump [Cribrihabitans marinus]
MFELLLSSLVTILPDYLYRRYVQGKRWGREITFFSMWYELRYGITLCTVLTISLITLVFFYHPSATTVTSYFRTVTILPETGGRVAEVRVENNQTVEAGDVLFRLDATSQQAAVETARRKIAEVEASQQVAGADLAAAEAGIEQASAALEQARDDLARNEELRDRGSSAVRLTEIERLENLVARREGEVAAAAAARDAVKENIDVLIPAQRASAQAALEQAEAELAKTTVVAGTSGRVEQFGLQVGDYVNPILRPAGILVPETFTEQERYVAGFPQISASVIKPGMFAEMGCLAKPFEVIPMVIVAVQDVIPAGQIRPTDRLRDPQDNARPGTITAFLEPLYAGQTIGIPAGATCIANAYTNNHDALDDEGLSTARWIYLHVVDTVGLVHAILLRIQMLLMPVTTLVLGEH